MMRSQHFWFQIIDLKGLSPLVDYHHKYQQANFNLALQAGPPKQPKEPVVLK